ncbi:ABC transporter permease [Granulicella cerasi]|uniref:ABC transporter permease n=1 Tax=Granulicella cerasi TaxID=741063 RepID=A0ABW1Z9X7_9BACT|nr:ABC transporter permease subunit [Granulicella cerasi]
MKTSSSASIDVGRLWPRESMNMLAAQIVGVVVLLLAWQFAGTHALAGKTLPPLTDVLHIFTISWRRALLLRSAASTLGSALIGLAAGSLLGIATAMLTRLLPMLEPGLDRLSVVVNAMPVIALGPVLIITAGREATPPLLAAVPVFFQMYVATTAGIAGAEKTTLQYLRATGASHWTTLLRLELPSALPTLISGLKVCVTTAMLGAIVGEWFGAARGLGIVILNTMQNFQIPLLWAAVLITASIALLGYVLMSMAERFVSRRMA